ncbi:hypothetical protein [Virgibacillus sp. YIM 98842]|uniref:hypothetical protein n=1 Tax=Virgibacillus sp. YIM 98842 TaxID=2663533 RepID=UPI0013D9A390|nr:hypothetical protein [Virgibacillus sp. YIM 98842]
MPLGQIILTVSLVQAFSGILSFIYRGKEKTDKGFAVMYHKLSYRRKLIRGIWMTPIGFAVLFLVFRIANIHPATEIIVYVIIAILFTGELTYNYIKWKRHEKIDEEH